MEKPQAGTIGRTLREAIEQAAARNCAHPYYRGLGDGSLPEVVNRHFNRQDTFHLLPGYGRAHARCAVVAHDPAAVRFLGRMAATCFDNAAAEEEDLSGTGEAPGGGVGGTEVIPPIAPTTLAYLNFLTAASVTSYVAGLGALLPSAWLQLLVSDHLLAEHRPNTRYAATIRQSHPGEEYRRLVEQFVDLVERVARDGSQRQREELLWHFDHASRYEWAFVEAAWRLEEWPAHPGRP